MVLSVVNTWKWLKKIEIDFSNHGPGRAELNYVLFSLFWFAEGVRAGAKAAAVACVASAVPTVCEITLFSKLLILVMQHLISGFTLFIHPYKYHLLTCELSVPHTIWILSKFIMMLVILFSGSQFIHMMSHKLPLFVLFIFCCLLIYPMKLCVFCKY